VDEVGDTIITSQLESNFNKYIILGRGAKYHEVGKAAQQKLNFDGE
jgi:hypothetical protein